MSAAKWVTVSLEYCSLTGQEVELMEYRVYPAETMPDGMGYRVAARGCSADILCNLAGRPCKWAHTNPCCDQLAVN